MKPSESEKRVRIGQQAIDWFVRGHSGNFTAQDFAEFKAWLYEDDEHCNAYMEIEILWNVLGSYENRPEMQALIKRTRALRDEDI